MRTTIVARPCCDLLSLAIVARRVVDIAFVGVEVTDVLFITGEAHADIGDAIPVTGPSGAIQSTGIGLIAIGE